MLPEGVEYELDLNRRQLIQVKTKRPMLDVNSLSYRSIVNQLSRLECKEYIHVLMDKPKVAKVELKRMHLKFEIDTTNPLAREYDIVSNEFSGLRISLEQKHGTLFGLNHGLYLENISNKCKSLLILPHGVISFLTSNNQHATVNIDVNGDLHNPPFHTYCVDEFLRQITSETSKYSAWLFLAYLHALTSLGTSDTFTGLTGTERSLQILQSSFIWSSPSAPYEQESIELLESIAKLSPERSCNQFKRVKWPKDIPTHVAQDAFILIVSKLLRDSQQLIGLDKNKTKHVDETKTELSLNNRDYLRWLQLYPNLHISNTFVKHEILKTEQSYHQECEKSLNNTRIISILHHGNEFHVTNDFNLKYFLTNWTYGTLDGIVHTNHADTILNHNNEVTLTNLWLSLYENARKQELSREKFALIYSLLAHQGKEDFQAILALQTVTQNFKTFLNVIPPSVSQYDVRDIEFSAEKISNILRSNHSCPAEYHPNRFSFNKNMNTEEEKIEKRNQYEQKIKENIESITENIAKKWPCDAVNSVEYINLVTDIQIDVAFEQINAKLLSWNNNRKLLLFIDKVVEKFQSLESLNADVNNLVNWSNQNKHFQQMKSKDKFSIDFESKLCEQLTEYTDDVRKAQQIYNDRVVENPEKLTHSADEWWQLFVNITQSSNAKHLIDAQMYPRLVASMVLPRLLSSQTDDRLKSIIGAFAITLMHEQRLRRIANFEQQPQMIVALEREKETEPHSNWLPREYPEWLLFEIEQNISIRRIQVEIARRMMHSPNTKTQHSVMQLNMGEGKTAVIVPILASVLSDGDKVCQIIVLKSLFATNLNSLRKYLGGMLNRRIYTFPCRRDMRIDEYVAKIMGIYDQCKLRKGEEKKSNPNILINFIQCNIIFEILFCIFFLLEFQ